MAVPLGRRGVVASGYVYTRGVTRPKDAGVRIGIDLSTTHSLAAVPMDGQAVIIPNRMGERLERLQPQ